MLSKLTALFRKPQPAAAPAADVPLAVAVLLVEAARADEIYDAREQSIIDAALRSKFGLDAAEAAALRARAETAQAEANDLHRYTRLAKTMSADEKIRFIEAMWRIALSDGARDPYEDALIRRLCGLIYVGDQESGAARRRVENELQRGGAQ